MHAHTYTLLLTLSCLCRPPTDTETPGGLKSHPPPANQPLPEDPPPQYVEATPPDHHPPPTETQTPPPPEGQVPLLPPLPDSQRPTEEERPPADKDSVNLISLDTPKHTPKHTPFSSPSKPPLSSQSSVASFTGLAWSRAEESGRDGEIHEEGGVSKVEETSLTSQDHPPVFDIPKDATPTKPSPAPRRKRGGPSQSSAEDLLTNQGTAVRAQGEVRGVDGTNTTSPLAVKPKPTVKPRAKKSGEEDDAGAPNDS